MDCEAQFISSVTETNPLLLCVWHNYYFGNGFICDTLEEHTLLHINENLSPRDRLMDIADFIIQKTKQIEWLQKEWVSMGQMNMWSKG